MTNDGRTEVKIEDEKEFEEEFESEGDTGGGEGGLWEAATSNLLTHLGATNHRWRASPRQRLGLRQSPAAFGRSD
jgi:hypothetical protein